MVASGAYELLDSGDLSRLERFGDRILVRPSKFSIWQPQRAKTEWAQAFARYEHGSGWFDNAGKLFQEELAWEIEIDQIKLRLRLQRNGQIGFFPEHLSYQAQLSEVIKKWQTTQSRPMRVLNLFAYTGLATLVCSNAGAEVTHVDLSSKVLDWTRENLELNSRVGRVVRLIEEDALVFVSKELRRNKQYDLIIADPPSFSRINNKQTWELEKIFAQFIRDLFKLMNPDSAGLFLTSHLYELGEQVMANLVYDAFRLERGPAFKFNVSGQQLLIDEKNSLRKLPAGFLVQATYGNLGVG